MGIWTNLCHGNMDQPVMGIGTNLSWEYGPTCHGNKDQPVSWE